MMKAVQTKAAATAAKKNAPFFNKADGQNLFNSSTNEQPFFSQKNSFFKPNNNPVQAKLTVGKPNDVYEKEADATADKVVQRLSEIKYQNSIQRKPELANSITPLLQTKCAECEKEDKLQKKEEIDDRDPLKNKVQTKPIFESNAEMPGEEKKLQRKCDACEKEDKEKLQRKESKEKKKLKDKLQTKSIFESNEEKNNIQRKCEHCDEEKKLQKKSETHSESVPANVESNLSASKNSGSRLPNNIRSQMENSFGADFSDVRIHNDSTANKMSKDLNAQAFTHGSDIYFNSGKYDTNSSSGKHLLAHELTHTVQQGTSQPIKKSTLQKVLLIQKAGGTDIKDIDAASLKALGETKEGYIEKTGSKIQFHFKDFPSKQYASPFLTKDEKGNEYISSPPFLKPTKERKTKQGSVWRKEALPLVTASLNEIITKKNVKGPSYLLRAHNNKKLAVTGTVDQIAKEIVVPFWGMDGKPVKHQIEHKVDWQIAGGNHDVDVISNLILLDAKENIRIGQTILSSMKKFYGKVIAFYDGKVDGIEKDFNAGSGMYEIYSDNLVSDAEAVRGSLISISNMDPGKTLNPVSEKLIDVTDEQIPPGSFVLRTSFTGAGNIVPYNFDNDFIEIKGDEKNHKLISVTLKNVVKDDKGVLDKTNPDKSLLFTEESQDHYKAKTEGFAALLKDSIRIKALSPVEWDEVDFNPLTGWNAIGKVQTNIKLLDAANITIELQNSNFQIQAVITSDALKDKLPKPFNIDYSSLTITAGSKDPFSVTGAVGFSIEKVGKGRIGATVGVNKFGLEGSFLFDQIKQLKKAEVGFKYYKEKDESKWEVNGELTIEKGTIKGVDNASVKIKYDGKKLTGEGNAKLSVPGIDTAKLNAEFADDGSFLFAADVQLKKLPGIKSGNVKATIASKKGEDGIKLKAEGKATPDFPNVPNLSADLAVLYDDGLFEIRTKIQYQKGRFDGTIELGVTNKPVDEKGQPQGDPNEKNELIIFGFGSLTVTLFKDIKTTISVRLTPDKQVLVSGEILLHNLSPFGEGYNFDKDLLKFPRIKIPLVGVPGLSISAFIDGGVHFRFNWQPLILKELKIDFQETNINELETVQLDIHGSVGSEATAEVFMEINAGLEADVAIISLSGSIGGQAGLGVTAEAGGEIDAGWNMDKGLQFKEIRAFLNIIPKAIFRLTGKVDVDLDLWVTTVNLYHHEWVLAQKELDLAGLTLKLDFPIKFNEQGNVIPPSYEDMNVQKPDFAGDKGKEVLDSALNSDAKKELEEKKQQIREKVRYDLRNSTNDKDFTPSKYREKMMEKYEKSPELQQFVSTTINEESRNLEYEQFENEKNKLRVANIPLANKLVMVNIYSMFHGYITEADFEAFKTELIQADEEKRKAATQNQATSNLPLNTPDNASPAAASANNNNSQTKIPAVQKKEIKNQNASSNENFQNALPEDLKATTNNSNQPRNFIIKNNSKNIISKKAEVDASGNYTGNYIFNPGHDGLNQTFFNRVKHNVADGTLDDAELTALRTDAIARNGTVMHVELLLMAAMRNPANVTLMQAHTTGSLIIPISQIRKADEDYLTNFGRESLPDEIAILNLRLLAAKLGLTIEKPDDVELKLNNKAQQYIMQYAGKQFADQADKLVIDAEFSNPKVPLTEIMMAMLNAAADSTPGDRVMAGTVYSIARKANHPMAGKILSGALQVDALIPSVYKRIAGGGDASYQYSTDADVLKSDTLYVPTSLDIFQLADRALVIHELTHAADDFATTGRQQIDSLKLETHAYKEQGKYMMDQILADPTATDFINTASQYTHSGALYYWAMVAAAKDDTTRYENVLVQINSAAPMSKSAADIRADLGLSVTALNTRVRNELLAYRDAGGNQLYFAGTTNVEGEAGHYFH